jgi:hypothetical protein
MANEVKISHLKGSTLYFRVFDSTGQVWNTSGTPAFEAWADGNVTDYDTAMTDKSSGEYIGSFPSTASGTFYVIAFLQDGGSPAITDVAVSSISSIRWTGSAETTIPDQIDGITIQANIAHQVFPQEPTIITQVFE